MTVETEVTRIIVEGNGATTVFAYSFPITGSSSTDQTNAELILTDSAGVSTTLTNSLWSITGVVTTGPIDGSASGTFTYSPAISTGSFLTLARIVPFEQTASLGSQGAYSPTVVENALDNLALQTEQLNTRLLQTVRAPITDDALSELPSAVDRARSFLFFDTAGDVTTASSTSGMASSILVGTNSTNASGTTELLMTGSGVSSVVTVAGVTTATFSGGGGTPGGSSGQIQYNASGSFGGITTLSGDVTLTIPTGVTTISSAVVTNAKLATVATQTIKGRTTAGTGAPEDLTATQATAVLNAMVGDSGAGVTKGLVPSASTGNATTAFLRKDGTWVAPSGTALTVKDGSTTVSSVTTVSFTSGATVTDGTGGLANVAVSGGGGGSFVFLEAHTASASAALTFTSISSTYNNYVIEIEGLIPTTDGTAFLMQLSTDGGSTWWTTANYTYEAQTLDNSGSNANNLHQTNQTSMQISGNQHNDTNALPFCASYRFMNPLSTTLAKWVFGSAAWNEASSVITANVSAMLLVKGTAFNAFKIFPVSSTIASGVVRLYGLSKS